MAKRGPKPLPANVHMLRGNPSKLPADKLLGEPRREVEIPECPSHLLPEAKMEWKRITAQLEKLGLVSQIDRAALAVYCQAWARWINAECKIQELGESGLVDTTPNGYRQMGAWLQVSNRAADQMRAFLVEFGMSPSSRSRVTPNPQMELFAREGDADKYLT